MIDAEMYGMIPNAKMDALLNEPPRNVFNKSKIPPCAPAPNKLASMPGSTMNEPNLKMIKNPIVFRILTLRSSIEKIFRIVSKKRFILRS
jgi:hypothetical protein